MLPLALVHVLEPRASTFMLIVAPFSMFPLLLKDGQALPYVALVGCTCVAAADITNAWSNFVLHALDERAQAAVGAEGAVPAALEEGAVEVGHRGAAGLDGPLPLAGEADERQEREPPVQMLPEPSEDSQLSSSTQVCWTRFPW